MTDTFTLFYCMILSNGLKIINRPKNVAHIILLVSTIQTTSFSSNNLISVSLTISLTDLFFPLLQCIHLQNPKLRSLAQPPTAVTSVDRKNPIRSSPYGSSGEKPSSDLTSWFVKQSNMAAASSSSTESPKTTTERRGIPGAQFVEDVETYLTETGFDVNSALAFLQERSLHFFSMLLKFFRVFCFVFVFSWDWIVLAFYLVDAIEFSGFSSINWLRWNFLLSNGIFRYYTEIFFFHCLLFS